MKNTQNNYTVENAISPLDGRNRHKLENLHLYFSEKALFQNRVNVEVQYLIFLSKYKIIRRLTRDEIEKLNKIKNDLSYSEVRTIEKRTNHDVKAVEEYLKTKLQETSLKDVEGMIHFGLTSEDINNLAYASMINGCIRFEILPLLQNIVLRLKRDAGNSIALSMLGRTHGQPAAPTTLGKELIVFIKRLEAEIEELSTAQLHGKLTGNTGGMNVHKLFFPTIDWIDFSRNFVSSLGFVPDVATTQIQHYDSYIRIFQTLLRINNILLDLSINMWTYIMIGYFQQKVIRQEVGSTALPHKVNPIYFEGAEGGFEIANALFEMYARKLSKSRLQRDLSDSTVRRSFGIAFGYSILSYQSILHGFMRISPNKQAILRDLQDRYEILSEPVQNLLRIRGKKNGYDLVKQFFRGRSISKLDYKKFIQKLPITEKDKKLLQKLKPESYTGITKHSIT